MPRKRIAVSWAQASDQLRNRSWRCRREQFVALARRVAHQQARFVQPAQEGPQLGFGDRPRRKLAGKLARHLGEAHRAAKHFQQRVLFRREMKMLERERILHNPRRRAGHLHRHGDQVGPQPEGEGSIVGGRWVRVMDARYSHDHHPHRLAGAEAAGAVVDLGPDADLAGDRIDLGADKRRPCRRTRRPARPRGRA